MLNTPVGQAEVDIPDPGDFKSFYVFAMHKSGSTLLNRMVHSALELVRIPQIAIPDIAFAAGLPEDEITNPEEFIFDSGYCYRGFRVFPPYLRNFDISDKKKILLVRDPRDMIVSYYFSIAESHIIPEGAIKENMVEARNVARTLPIDSFCRQRVDYFVNEFDSYEHIMASELNIYRYEDVIFKKEEWLTEILTYFDVSIRPAEISRIATENDIYPEEERPEEHIRQVRPGNFRKHLQDDTIKFLNKRFNKILTTYDYMF